MLKECCNSPALVLALVLSSWRLSMKHIHTRYNHTRTMALPPVGVVLYQQTLTAISGLGWNKTMYKFAIDDTFSQVLGFRPNLCPSDLLSCTSSKMDTIGFALLLPWLKDVYFWDLEKVKYLLWGSSELLCLWVDVLVGGWLHWGPLLCLWLIFTVFGKIYLKRK